MLRILAAAALVSIFAPALARAEAVGYYDVAKVHADCADCKTAADALKADETRWDSEVDKAAEDAKKAADACAKTAGQAIAGPCSDMHAKQQHHQQILAQYQKAYQQRAAANYQQIESRVRRLLPAMAKAKHLTAVLPVGGAVYVAPGSDLSAEVTRRLDAGEGKDDDQVRAENAKLKAENDALKAKAAKPEPPPKK